MDNMLDRVVVDGGKGNALFSRLASEMAHFYGNNPEEVNINRTGFARSGKVNITPLIMTARNAEILRQPNGGVLLSVTDKAGKKFNHAIPANSGDAFRINSILTNKHISEEERATQLTRQFTTIGVKMMASQNFDNLLQQEISHGMRR